jgi:hypothetical protein
VEAAVAQVELTATIGKTDRRVLASFTVSASESAAAEPADRARGGARRRVRARGRQSWRTGPLRRSARQPPAGG